MKSLFTENDVPEQYLYVPWSGDNLTLSHEQSYDYLRERLESHQKIIGQHPELYNGKVFLVELPLAMAKYESMYTWFIPFSMKFKIHVIFLSDGKEGGGVDVSCNIVQLRHIGVAMKIKPCAMVFVANF